MTTVKRSAVDRARLLKRLEKAWDRLRESYAGLSDAQLMEPGVTGEWSVRDIIAHVTTWEEEALKHLGSILEGRRPPRYSVMYGGIDAFNARMTAEKAGLALSEILRRRDEVHQRIIEVIRRTPEEQLVADTRFRRRLRLDTSRSLPEACRGHTEMARTTPRQRCTGMSPRSKP